MHSESRGHTLPHTTLLPHSSLSVVCCSVHLLPSPASVQATTSGPILEPFSGSLLLSAEFHRGGGFSLTFRRELSSVSTVPCDFYTTAFTSLCSDPGSLACLPNSTLRIKGDVICLLCSASRTQHVFGQCFENKFKEKEFWANTLVTPKVSPQNIQGISLPSPILPKAPRKFI